MLELSTALPFSPHSDRKSGLHNGRQDDVERRRPAVMQASKLELSNHALRTGNCSLKCSASVEEQGSPHLRWLHDPFDNSVAVATFEGSTSELSFESTVTLEHFENTLPEYPLEEYARSYPFRYSDEDFPNLVRALQPHYHAESVAKWALHFLDPSETTGTMKMLRAMTSGIRNEFHYNRRSEKGVQSPEETLRLGRGSCRDFAVLMMEACRSLGVAARFVSGYIFTPNSSGLAGGEHILLQDTIRYRICLATYPVTN